MSERSGGVDKFYDVSSSFYHEQYKRDKLYDISFPYPANYFRLQLLLNSFITKNIKRVIEVGVGEGTPLCTLAKAGIDVWGFDISTEMVKKSKETMQKNNLDPEHIFWGDIQDPTTYVQVLSDGQFDGLMAMGVMPHIENDNMVLKNMSSLVRSKGSVFVEFRNKLFSLFTFNRYSLEFILDDLLSGVSEELKNLVRSDLTPRLRMDMPPIRDKRGNSDAPGYDAILSRFHNPFEVIELFKRNGFIDIKLLWYHYHPSMPYLEVNMPELYRREAIQLEHESSNWRGLFLCSAFVIEAIKG